MVSADIDVSEQILPSPFCFVVANIGYCTGQATPATGWQQVWLDHIVLQEWHPSTIGTPSVDEIVTTFSDYNGWVRYGMEMPFPTIKMRLLPESTLPTRDECHNWPPVHWLHGMIAVAMIFLPRSIRHAGSYRLHQIGLVLYYQKIWTGSSERSVWYDWPSFSWTSSYPEALLQARRNLYGKIIRDRNLSGPFGNDSSLPTPSDEEPSLEMQMHWETRCLMSGFSLDVWSKARSRSRIR